MKYIRDIVTTILIALAIFVLLQLTIGSFIVRGTSMLPNIQHGECIMVNKVSYFFEDPDHGDVIIFHSPRNPNSDLVKRIIALPGDTVEIKDNKLFINNIPLVEPYIKEVPTYKYPLQEIPADHYFVLGDNRNISADSSHGWLLPRENIVGKAWVTYWPIPSWKTMEHYTLNID